MTTKKFLLGAVCAGALTLAGCLTAAQVTQLIEQVQADVAKTCSVIPDAESIAELFAGYPDVAAALAAISVITSEVCGAVASANPAMDALPHHYDARVPRTHERLTPPPVTVNGVVVHFL